MSGWPDSNWRPERPKRPALPTAPHPEFARLVRLELTTNGFGDRHSTNWTTDVLRLLTALQTEVTIPSDYKTLNQQTTLEQDVRFELRPLLGRQMLYRLSYILLFVEVEGFEPTIPKGDAFTVRWATNCSILPFVENIGVEPMASCVQGKRSSQLS